MSRLRRGLAALVLTASVLAPAWGANYLAQGVVRSDRRVEITSKVASPIRAIPVVEGQSVKKGDLLVEMVNDAERAHLDAAKADAERARSALSEAEQAKKTADREYTRNKMVADLITRRELEMSEDAVAKAASTLAMSQQELARAEAMVAAAAATLDNTLLRAPVDGLVSRIYARVGSIPKIADTTLLDLLTLEDLSVEVALPLGYIRQVRKGLPASIAILRGPAGSLRARGKIDFVYPEIDPTTRMMRVKVSLDTRDKRVLPGMFAEVDLGLPELTPDAPDAGPPATARP